MPVGALVEEIEENRRRRAPSRAFELVLERHDKVLEYQFALGRWIMASLLLVNGGALLALLNVVASLPHVVGKSVALFIVGLVSALIGGVAAWFNCNLVMEAHDERLDWRALDTKKSARADKFDRWAWRLSWVVISFMVVSLIAFTIGAIAASTAIEITRDAGDIPGEVKRPARPRT